MARISWTPIVAPDIGESAIRAQAMAGSALSGAFSGFSGLLNDWEAAQRDKNLAEIYTRQNAFAANNDVAGYAADLADGDLMKGLKYLRPQDIAAARGFTNELRAGRNSEFSYGRQVLEADRSDKTYERTEADRVRRDDIVRTLSPFRQLVSEGKMTRAQFQAEAQKVMPGANASDIEAMFSMENSGIQTFRGDVNWGRDEIRWGDERQNRAWTVEDREVQQQAEALALRFKEYGPNVTQEDLIGSAEYQNASPRVRAQALALSGLQSGLAAGSFSGGEAAPVGGRFAGTASNALDVLNYNARGGGFGSIPESVKTYGDLDNFGTQMLRANGVTSSASGPYQITRDTRREFAARVLGPNWQSLPRSLESEDRIARAIFEDAKRKGPAAISGRWAAIDANEAARLARMPWEQAREIIAAQEGGARLPSPAEIQGGSISRSVGAAVQRSIDPNARQARTIFEGLTDDSTMLDVVKRYTSKGGDDQPAGPFSTLNERQMGQVIREVQDRYSRQHSGAQLPPAAAAAIAASAITPYDARKDLFRNLTGRARPIGSEGFLGTPTDTLNWDQIDSRLNRLRNGGQGLAEDVINNENSQAIIDQSIQGRAQLEQARAALTAQLARDEATGIRNNPATLRLQRQVLQLEQQWGANAAAGDQFLQNYGVPPRPSPVASGPSMSFAGTSVRRPQRTPYIPQ